MMLRKIEFENFMSLKQVSVDLEPLTIFVGSNASGKSSIFKALVTLSRLLGGVPVRGPRGEFYLEKGVTLDHLVWGNDTTLPIRFRLWFEDDAEEPGYSLELAKKAEGWGVTRERIRAGEKWIEVDNDHHFEHPTERGTMVYRPPLRATLRYLVHTFMRDSAARPVIEPVLQLTNRFGRALRYRPSAIDIAAPVVNGPKTYVHENGRGVAVELQNLLGGPKRDVFDAIERAVSQLFPHIKRIHVPNDGESSRLSFETDRSKESILGSQESDGALLATFLYWRLYTADPQLKICWEEPENGLHPYLLGSRFALLKEFAFSKEPPPVQILVATHSPYLLRVIHSHPLTFLNELRLVGFQKVGTPPA